MRLFILLALSLPSILFAQKTCYGSFEVFGAAGISGGAIEESSLRDITGPAFATHFGFGASFKVGRSTIIRTSAQYADYGNHYSFDGLTWGSQHDGMGGFDPTLPGEEDSGIDFKYRHMYVEAHVALRQYFPTYTRLRPFAELGLGAGKYVTTQNINKANGWVEHEPTDAFRSVSPVGRAGLGADMMLNENFGFYGMAVFQHHLRPIEREGIAKIRPWQAGLEVGIRVFVDNR